MNYAQLNLDALKNEIDRFEALVEMKAYIICNKETAQSILSSENVPLFDIDNEYIGDINRWRGNKILIDNDLSFGEIYVR